MPSDGTKKFKVDFVERGIAFVLYEIPFGGLIEGNEDDSKITIFGRSTQETYA